MARPCQDGWDGELAWFPRTGTAKPQVLSRVSHPARVRSDRFPSRTGLRACLSSQPYSPPLGLLQPRPGPSRSRHRIARGQLHLTGVEWRIVSNSALENQTRLDVSVNDTTNEMVADAYLTRLGERGI